VGCLVMALVDIEVTRAMSAFRGIVLQNLDAFANGARPRVGVAVRSPLCRTRVLQRRCAGSKCLTQGLRGASGCNRRRSTAQ
jgi:hypothetical protein